MLVMSIADVLSSVMIALATLLNPAHMPREDEFAEMTLKGKRLGNTTTCDMQGFIVLFGVVFMVSCNGSLCVYYACAIAFRMKAKNIRRYVEPLLYIIPFTVALVLSIIALRQELYNPWHPRPWCGLGVYPVKCLDDPAVECIRGEKKILKRVIHSSIITIASSMTIVCVSLGCVVWRVVDTDREMAAVANFYHARNCDHENFPTIARQQRNTRAVLWQALAYVGTLLVTQIIPLGVLLSNRKISSVPALLVPLQGFFNFLIFLWHKVYTYRSTDPTLTHWNVIRRYFSLSSAVEERIFVSGIAILQLDLSDNDSVLVAEDEHNRRITSVSSAGQNVFVDTDETQSRLASPCGRRSDDELEMEAGKEARLDGDTDCCKDLSCKHVILDVDKDGSRTENLRDA